MSNAIDCTIMSHPACEEPAAASASPTEGEPRPAASAPAPAAEPLFASYECVNQCASSLGVVTLVEGAVSGLGCIALPPACPAFIAAIPVTILEACDSACRELERP
ncbi:MAG TPA: hypothetical protein VMI54_26450 [Polyangiaceae bacterium]|nr:hypothetical protein [Polyangiaceae bacterium]